MLSRQAEGREWSGGDRSGVEGTGVEWRGGEGRGGEGRAGQGRAGQGRVPDCLGGLSRVGISSRSTRPWNGQPPSIQWPIQGGGARGARAPPPFENPKNEKEGPPC